LHEAVSHGPPPVDWREAVALAGLCLLLLVLNASSAVHKTPTTDEWWHLHYGHSILRGDATRLEDSKMPVSAFNALAYGEPKYFEEPRPLFRARMVTALFSLLLGLLTWHWARTLYGPAGGLLALGVYVVCPSMIAHSRLATTDLYAALGVTVTAFSGAIYAGLDGWERPCWVPRSASPWWPSTPRSTWC